MNTDKRFQPWRPLHINQRVKLTGKYRKGQQGTIVEADTKNITGLANYAIRLDDRNQLADVRRHEITKVKS